MILRRSSVFNEKATFGNYVSLLGKACFFPRFSTKWLTPAVRHVARGLGKCQDRSFRFSELHSEPPANQNCGPRNRSERIRPIVLLSFLFSFRVPSETLQLRRAYATDQLEGFTPQLEKALIAVRTIDGQQFPLVKLTTRKTWPPAAFCAGHVSATW